MALLERVKIKRYSNCLLNSMFRAAGMAISRGTSRGCQHLNCFHNSDLLPYRSYRSPQFPCKTYHADTVVARLPSRYGGHISKVLPRKIAVVWVSIFAIVSCRVLDNMVAWVACSDCNRSTLRDLERWEALYRHRPMHSIKDGPKAWWVFLVKCVSRYALGL